MSFKKHISVPHPDAQEQGFMSQAAQLLGQGRAGLESVGVTEDQLAPYLYSLAGLTPQYSEGPDNAARVAELQGNADTAQSALTARKTMRGPGGRAAAMALASGGGLDLSTLKGKTLKGKLKKYLQATQKEAGRLAATGRRITGFAEDPAQTAARAKEQALYGQQQDMLKKSMSMNNDDVLAADPALKRQLEEEQAKLQQAQVGQFGSLAEAGSGTVGAVQNAAMAQRRAEAISNARRENIGLYAGLMTQQAGLNAGANQARAGQASVPTSQREQLNMNFGNLASGYGGLLAAKAGQRAEQFQANSFNQTQPGLGESILKGIGSLLQPMKQSG